MEPFPDPAPHSHQPRPRLPPIAIVLVITGLFALIIWIWPSGNSKPEPTDSPTPGNSGMPADALDHYPVIGVSIGDKHRAYTLAALFQPDSHVINDLLGDLPVSVTYCDLNDCVRVFTASDREQPLDISVAGGKERRMWLGVGEHRYWQDSGLPVDSDLQVPFPYAEAKYERTTLREWLELHPDSDVQLGRMPFAFPNKMPFKLAPPIKGSRER